MPRKKVEDPTLQRRHWKQDEKDVLSLHIVSGDLIENMHPDAVPPLVLRKLPGRSSESVRQYVRKHFSELLGSTLVCDAVIDSFNLAAPRKRGRPPKGSRDLERFLDGMIEEQPAPPLAAPPPPPPVLAARPASPVPELYPPLPRAITYGAKRMRLDSVGFMSTPIFLPGSSFDDINKKLRMQRDARLENWDGLPRFM